MHIDIISVLPELMDSFFSHSIMKRAISKELLTIQTIPLRPYGLGPNKQIDDYSYGGEAGMVMMCEPLANCIDDLKKKRDYDDIIYLTPDGEKYDQKTANQLATYDSLLIICGHYKGIDQRIRDIYVTREISIGDYVLSGGEIAACVIVDSIGRLIPGVLGNETSALTDSFQDQLLAPPVYTRPEDWRGLRVPDVLTSGHHEKIQNWNLEKSLEKTKKNRPDLLI